MSLFKALNQRSRLELPVLPPFNTLTRAVSNILQRWPDVVPDPPDRDREALVMKMKERLERDDWEGARMSFVLSAARATFDEQRRNREDLSELREFYAAETAMSGNATFLNGMSSVYFGCFDPGAPHTRMLAKALSTNISRIGVRWRDLFQRLPKCLDPDYAHEDLANLMVNMSDPWSELKMLGVKLPHAPGLMDFAHLSYVQKLQPQLRDIAGVDKLFGWLRPPGQQAKMSGAAEAITAILSPWTSRDPSRELVSHITQSLVSAYQDPRVSRGGAWSGVPDSVLSVIMRWLTGENIRFFLDTVTAVEDSHMWEPRRKFWLKLYEQGRIAGAWVAFSDEAERHARNSLARTGARQTLSYGHQRGGRRNTSLLILDTGTRIVVEGSHNYMVHVFRKDSTKTPQLYQKVYDCEAIRLIANQPRGFHEARVHDAPGNWRNWVQERI